MGWVREDHGKRVIAPGPISMASHKPFCYTASEVNYTVLLYSGIVPVYEVRIIVQD